LEDKLIEEDFYVLSNIATIKLPLRRTLLLQEFYSTNLLLVRRPTTTKVISSQTSLLPIYIKVSVKRIQGETRRQWYPTITTSSYKSDLLFFTTLLVLSEASQQL